MREKAYDVIVIGLGAMGTAAAFRCAGRGLRVLGIEQFEAAHQRGSSHGKSRVIRKAYFEDPRYVPLLLKAYEEWRNVESLTGTKLLNLVGCLNIGPATHEAIIGVRASVRQHNLPHEVLNASEIRKAWPCFQPAEQDVGIFEADAGFLSPELAIQSMTTLARQRGVELVMSKPALEWSSNGKAVHVQHGNDTVTAPALIITAGSWLPHLVPSLQHALKIERQVQAWFKPCHPERFEARQMPVFIHFADRGDFYGIPPGDSTTGIKIARHHGGEITTADTVDRQVRDDDERDIRQYIRHHMPAADGPMLEARICLYTNTPDSHFIIDRHPGFENVLIAGGFSGHGFKFAPLVGGILADLLTDDKTSHPIELFRISRFSGGATRACRFSA